LGDNEKLTDISFLAYMPDLEIVILSGSDISDLTPLGNAQKLIFLELVYCGNLQDLTALEGCTSLANINLSYTDVTDISSLHQLPLERLYAVQTKIEQEAWDEIAQLHPDCAIRYDGTQAHGTGWRYKKNGAYTDIYKRVREVFGLDAAATLGTK
jgi:hypothetical protein